MIIKNLSTFLGSEKINQEKLYGKDFISKTGIPTVYKSPISSLDLIKKALLQCNESDFKNVSALIHVTQSEVYSMPNDASFIQDYAGIPKDSLCLTINQGCSGFVQAVGIANSLIGTYGCERVMIVTSDTYRKFCSQDDRSTSAIFSDAASINIVDNEKGYRVDNFVNYTDGSGSKHLIKENKADKSLYMNGTEVYKFAKNVVLTNIIKKHISKDLLETSSFYIHQASDFVLNELYRYLPEKNCPNNLALYGNTVSTTIPLLMQDFPLKKEKVFLIGFGVGLSASLMELTHE
jgi:3-oxoacyl-[acyl-carrier-protein] synthase III